MGKLPGRFSYEWPGYEASIHAVQPSEVRVLSLCDVGHSYSAVLLSYLSLKEHFRFQFLEWSGYWF